MLNIKARSKTNLSAGFLFAVLLFLSAIVNAQKAEIIKLDKLNSILSQKNDTTYVINFWATWCKPCIEELPYFLELEKSTTGKVKFIYVSLDFKREVDTRLNKFLEKYNVASTVYLIDEPDYDKWINLVDPSWEGNIPVTLIYNNSKDKRLFHPKEFSKQELIDTLGKF